MLKIIGIISLTILGLFLAKSLFIYFMARVIKGRKISFWESMGF